MEVSDVTVDEEAEQVEAKSGFDDWVNEAEVVVQPFIVDRSKHWPE